MDIACPKCGSEKLRFSRVQSVAERIKTFVGYYPIRCRECRTRFVARVWDFTSWRYARCPECYRTDLTTWSEEHYTAVGMTALKASLGARRYRCAQCRVNFASFRPRRRKPQRWRKVEKPELHQERERTAESQPSEPTTQT